MSKQYRSPLLIRAEILSFCINGRILSHIGRSCNISYTDVMKHCNQLEEFGLLEFKIIPHKTTELAKPKETRRIALTTAMGKLAMENLAQAIKPFDEKFN